VHRPWSNTSVIPKGLIFTREKAASDIAGESDTAPKLIAHKKNKYSLNTKITNTNILYTFKRISHLIQRSYQKN